MTKIRSTIAVLSICLLSIFASNLTSQAESLFLEDWQSGAVNSSLWQVSVQTTQGGGTSQLELANPWTGDYAFMTMGPAGSSGSDHTNWLRSNNSWARGENLRCTFKIWNNPGRKDNWVGGHPAYIGIAGPWHSSNSGAILWDVEAMIRYWSTQYFAQPGDGWPTGGEAMGATFQTAIQNAVGKDSAMLIRVTLGDAQGASCEWSDDAGASVTIGQVERSR